MLEVLDEQIPERGVEVIREWSRNVYQSFLQKSRFTGGLATNQHRLTFTFSIPFEA